jgi:hypothetical protein
VLLNVALRGLVLERDLRDADDLERRLSELEARLLRPEKGA